MWTATGRCLLTWLRVTVILGALLVVVGLVWGFGTRPFVLATLVAVIVELLAIRGLLREWVFEARGRWWWL